MDGSGVPLDLDAELECMFRAHAAFVSRVLRRFGVRAADLPDACQDVFLVVHRRLAEFEGRAAYRTWLYRICVCVASDYRKRTHRRYERPDQSACDARAASATAERAAATAQLAQRIALALDRLDEAKRRVFLLYELEELPMNEVAARLGCPLKTAFSRLYAARRELRAELVRAGIGGGLGLLWVLRPLRAHAAWWCGAAAAQAGAIACAAGLVTVAALGASAAHTQRGPVLTADASLESNVPSFVVRPAPEPSVARVSSDDTPRLPDAAPRVTGRRHVRKAEPDRSATAMMDASPAQPAAATEKPVEWIHAPVPERSARASEPAPPQIGLDEVLAATSVKPLMRLGPAGAARPFSLVPQRARTR